MKTLVVGIRGKRGSGKDELGAAMSYAAEKNGFRVHRIAYGDAVKTEISEFLVKYSFAEVLDFLDAYESDRDKVDAILAQTYATAPKTLWEHVRSWVGFPLLEDFRGVPSGALVELMHDRNEKERFRLFMQWYATEYRRYRFSMKYWLTQVQEYIDATIETAKDMGDETSLFFYIPDVRFPNEVEFAQDDLEAYVISIDRPGHDAGDPHISEVALDNYPDFNARVNNDKTLIHLRNTGATLFVAAAQWKFGVDQK